MGSDFETKNVKSSATKSIELLSDAESLLINKRSATDISSLIRLASMEFIWLGRDSTLSKNLDRSVLESILASWSNFIQISDLLRDDEWAIFLSNKAWPELYENINKNVSEVKNDKKRLEYLSILQGAQWLLNSGSRKEKYFSQYLTDEKKNETDIPEEGVITIILDLIRQTREKIDFLSSKLAAQDYIFNNEGLTNVQGSGQSRSMSPSLPSELLKPTAEEIEHTKEELFREINRIDIWTNNLVDNGLFDKQKKAFEVKGIDPDKVFEDIQKNLKEARTTLYDGDLSESGYLASKALRSYDKALYSSSRLWRFSNVYAGPIWIYLVGFLVVVLVFHLYQLDANFLDLDVGIQEAALHAATWGAVGAILRGVWYLKDKVIDRNYRNSFTIYFLSSPFLGGLFGAIAYFLLVAGLFMLAPAQAPSILNQTPSGPNATQAGIVSTVAIIPLAALAGFNWEWAIMIFKKIGDSFHGERKPEDKIEH